MINLKIYLEYILYITNIKYSLSTIEITNKLLIFNKLAI
jgi:hypothetical protein